MLQIIYLNGPTSSGKTTLAKALQDVLEPPFLHIGIDKIIEMMPERLNDWEGGNAPSGFSWKHMIDSEGKPIHELKIGPFAQKICDSYLEIVALLARLDHRLIVDDVGISDEEFNRWKDKFRNHKVLYVGVKAPLGVLEQREETRGNRIVGSARAQFQKIKYGEMYDVELDTSVLSIDECVEMIRKFVDAEPS
jgi:chloramphenicol 3-O phosphotransferase